MSNMKYLAAESLGRAEAKRHIAALIKACRHDGFSEQEIGEVVKGYQIGATITEEDKNAQVLPSGQ